MENSLRVKTIGSLTQTVTGDTKFATIEDHTYYKVITTPSKAQWNGLSSLNLVDANPIFFEDGIYKFAYFAPGSTDWDPMYFESLDGKEGRWLTPSQVKSAKPVVLVQRGKVYTV